MRIISEPELPREVTREIAEHETLLVWNADVHTEMFQDWWNAEGMKAFKRWAIKHDKDYSR